MPSPTVLSTTMRSRLVVACTFAVSLPAQQSGSPALALPHGFSIDPATALPGTGPGDLALSDTGIDGVLPAPRPPGLVVPDFGTFLAGAAVDVDAFSLGLDWVVANAALEATVPAGQWAALTYTVSRATVGAPGKVVFDEASRPDGAAADVFAYVLPGSVLPPQFVAIPFRAQDSVEIAGFGGLANLDAHDLYVSLLYYENPTLAATLPPPTIFFSVSAASVAAIPAAWTASPALRSGATVFATTWVPASMSWTPVAVAYAPGFFGLDASEDLDALALDLTRGLALLSTDPLRPPPGGGMRDPILISSLGSGASVPYVLAGGGPPISAEVGLGLGIDDVDGICALDPGSPALPSAINLPRMFGLTGFLLPLGPGDVQASAWRRTALTGTQEQLVTWMTGWPPPGTPQPSLAFSTISVGAPYAGLTVLDIFVRPAGNPFDGHPEHTVLPIPPGLSGSGIEIYFAWGAISTTALDASLPVGIVL